jgi:VanZ family protein
MLLRWLALAGWMIAILLNSSVPGAPLPTTGLLSTLINKLGHVLEYALLGYLAWRALVEPAGGLGLRPRGAVLTILVGGLLFASLDELRQLFVAGRGSSAWDVLLDVAALGLTVALLRRDAPQSPLEPAGGDGQHLAAEDGQEEVHRQHLAVAVDVRQEDHHHAEVQPDEGVQQPGRS